jgi:hypothetical protein
LLRLVLRAVVLQLKTEASMMKEQIEYTQLTLPYSTRRASVNALK